MPRLQGFCSSTIIHRMNNGNEQPGSNRHPSYSKRSVIDDIPVANRELSFLAFDERVLALARDTSVPLLERLRFLCISSSNLDEFFEIRVAGIKQKIQGGIEGAGIDGLSPMQQLSAITIKAHMFVEQQYQLLNDELIPALSEQGIRFFSRDSFFSRQLG